MTTADVPATEGVDGTDVTYVERLRPSLALWALVPTAAAFLAVAYGVALGLTAGIVTFVILCALGAWVVGRTAVLVQVDDRVLRAGRARLPLRYIGRVRPLNAEAAAVARGPGADGNAYLVLRVGYADTAVAVEVADPRDPHSYWLVSTRHPHRLASAIMSAKESLPPGPETPDQDA